MNNVFEYAGKSYRQVDLSGPFHNSSIVRDVVRRGDIFAIEIGTDCVKILPRAAIPSVKMINARFNKVGFRSENIVAVINFLAKEHLANPSEQNVVVTFTKGKRILDSTSLVGDFDAFLLEILHIARGLK